MIEKKQHERITISNMHVVGIAQVAPGSICNVMCTLWHSRRSYTRSRCDKDGILQRIDHTGENTNELISFEPEQVKKKKRKKKRKNLNICRLRDYCNKSDWIDSLQEDYSKKKEQVKQDSRKTESMNHVITNWFICDEVFLLCGRYWMEMVVLFLFWWFFSYGFSRMVFDWTWSR